MVSSELADQLQAQVHDSQKMINDLTALFGQATASMTAFVQFNQNYNYSIDFRPTSAS